MRQDAKVMEMADRLKLKSYPASDCQWCSHYSYNHAHYCDNARITRNIYTDPCPKPDKRRVGFQSMISV